MRLGAGPGRTRDDHLELAAQIYALAAEARRARELVEVLGEDALSDAERRRLEFAAAMSAELLAQGRERGPLARGDASSADGGSSRACPALS